MWTQFQLLLLWQKLFDIVLFLPRENLGWVMEKNYYIPWRTPGILLSSFSENHENESRTVFKNIVESNSLEAVPHKMCRVMVKKV